MSEWLQWLKCEGKQPKCAEYVPPGILDYRYVRPVSHDWLTWLKGQGPKPEGSDD